jgi:hypothetical protein
MKDTIAMTVIVLIISGFSIGLMALILYMFGEDFNLTVFQWLWSVIWSRICIIIAFDK